MCIYIYIYMLSLLLLIYIYIYIYIYIHELAFCDLPRKPGLPIERVSNVVDYSFVRATQVRSYSRFPKFHRCFWAETPAH